MTIASIEIPHHWPSHHQNPQPPLALSLHSKPHKPQATKTKTKKKKDQFVPNSIWVMLLQTSAQWSPED